MKVLVVDDEKLIVWSLSKQFSQAGYQVLTADCGQKALEIFEREKPSVVLLDNKLPDIMGLEVLRAIRQQSPSTIIFFMTAFSSVETAVEAMKLGAYEFIEKPINIDLTLKQLQNALQANKIDRDVLDLRDKLHRTRGYSNIVGDSQQMRHIFEIIHKIALSEATTVLIQGESGTGKELVAEAIHYESNRFQRPFVAINCSALPETLLESELFGYEKGAFTDAKQMKRGQFELAEGGTLLLDEIGEISPSIQVKLLRVLENRTFKRLGGVQDIRLNVRVIASTNRDLAALVQAGTFRTDLYYRLKVINIHIPPLRERPEDILAITNHFIQKFNDEFGKNFLGLDSEVEALFLSYPWPGNVRELRNVIERVLILENDEFIRLKHLPSEMLLGGVNGIPIVNKGLQLCLPKEGFPLEEIEKIVIEKALQYCNGNQSKAAELLHITRDTIRYKMKKYGLM